MLAIVSLVPFKPSGALPQVSFVVEALAPLGRSFIAHFNSFLVLLTYMLQRAHMRASPACVDSLPTPRCSLERGMASHPAGGGLWYKVLYTFRYKSFLVQSFRTAFHRVVEACKNRCLI